MAHEVCSLRDKFNVNNCISLCPTLPNAQSVPFVYSLHSQRTVMLQLWCHSALLLVLLWLSNSFSNAEQAVLSENQRKSNETLLWGPYRPNLYFGVRPRIPKSLTTGLLWARTDNFEKVQHSKHLKKWSLTPQDPIGFLDAIGLTVAFHRRSSHM